MTENTASEYTASTEAGRSLPRHFDRRAILGLGGAAVGTAAVAMLPGGAAHAAPCVNEASLPLQRSVGGATMYYVETLQPAGARLEPAFFARLGAWKTFWQQNTTYSPMDQLIHYGGYNNRNDGCVSMHNYGRAFDITSAWSGTVRQFSLRYDIWRSWTGSQLTTVRRQYWTAAASFHLYFEHTLTYLFNTAHHNHIHIDNKVSGSGLSRFSGTTAQVQALQAMLNYVWAKGTKVDGVWGPQTDRHAREVLTRIGKPGSVSTASATGWRNLLTATTRKGSGRQAY